MKPQAGRLLYDSSRAGAHIGTRAGLGIDRTLLFGASGVTVDLMIHGSGSLGRYVQGQVVADRDEVGISDADVAFADGAEHTKTDAFGEFALPVPAGSATRILRIQAPDLHVECVVPLAPEELEVTP